MFSSHMLGSGSATNLLVLRCRSGQLEVVFEAGAEGLGAMWKPGELTVTHPVWKPGDSSRWSQPAGGGSVRVAPPPGPLRASAAFGTRGEALNNMTPNDDGNAQPFYHGTKADLKPDDLIEPGYASNYGQRKEAAFVYLTATLDAAIWGAELAVGAAAGRIYIVEPTGPIEDDPNLTNKRFPGNPTKSYRSRSPVRVLGEVQEWTGHAPERLKEMRDHLEDLKRRGVEAIEE